LVAACEVERLRLWRGLEGQSVDKAGRVPRRPEAARMS